MGITTDIIVGFPGETEEDFEETLSLAREAQFDNGYLFKYSPRKDTPAADMPGQVPQAVKEERNARLLAVINDIGAAATTSAWPDRSRCWWKGRAGRIPRGCRGGLAATKLSSSTATGGIWGN